MYDNIKMELIIQNSLSVSIKNSLLYLFDNSSSLDRTQLENGLLSVINQIDINYSSFNLVLDKIDILESNLKAKN